MIFLKFIMVRTEDPKAGGLREGTQQTSGSQCLVLALGPGEDKEDSL